MTRRWRLVDLAARAGISDQQVRNYLAAGLLPPAGRAENNYRVFTDHHADALRTVRALAAGHGWAHARTILTAVHHGDLAAALAAVDDSHADLARERATRLVAVLRAANPTTRCSTRTCCASTPTGTPTSTCTATTRSNRCN